MKNHKRETFSTGLGVFFATLGSAVGLGNIWKFPYLTGANGGAEFLLTYLICVIFVGIPIMIAEFYIGRKICAVRAITLPGAGEGIKFLFTPNFKLITPEVILVALGLAFFKLSVGMGTMATYGSYFTESNNMIGYNSCNWGISYSFRR